MIACHHFKSAVEVYQDLKLCKACTILMSVDNSVCNCVVLPDWHGESCGRCHDKRIPCERIEDTAIGRAIQEKFRFLAAVFLAGQMLEISSALLSTGLTRLGVRKTVQHFRNEFKKSLVDARMLESASEAPAKV